LLPDPAMEGLRVCEFFHKRELGYRHTNFTRNLSHRTGPGG